MCKACKLTRQAGWLLVPVLVLLGSIAPAALAQESPAGAVPPAPNAPAATLGIAHGAHLRPVFVEQGTGSWYSYGDEVLAMNNLVGKDLAIVMYFVPWSPFDPFLLDEIQRRIPKERRPVIMLTWEPSSYSSGCDLGYGDDAEGPIRAINAGHCDDFIRSYARALKARPERFILRFAHEMNIADAAWWPGHYGLDAASYVAMYRRVRGIFRAEDTQNVEWMWSPNHASDPQAAWNDIFNYYPGDADVDWIGLSGYNWYTWRSRPWATFEALYQDVLQTLACRYAKPVIIAEIGSVAAKSSGSKAEWISNLYDELEGFPFVRGVVWYNDYAFGRPDHADFRVTTGGQDCHDSGGCTGVEPLPGAAGRQTTDAYISGVRRTIYSSQLVSLTRATPPAAWCPGQSQSFSLTPTVAYISPGRVAQVRIVGLLYPASAEVTLLLPPGIRGVASPSTLLPPWGTSTVRLWGEPKLAPGIYASSILVGSTKLPLTIVNTKPRFYLPGVAR